MNWWPNDWLVKKKDSQDMFQISCSNKNIISCIRNECYEMNTLLNFFLCTNMRWRESSSLKKLYIQGKKEEIYNTDLALPAFFIDKGKAIAC